MTEWKLSVLCCVSAFIASKTMTYLNPKGEPVRSNGLKINQVIENCQAQPDDFFLCLKECSTVMIIDETVHAEIKQLVQSFSFLLAFHSKFSKLFIGLELLEVQRKRSISRTPSPLSPPQLSLSVLQRIGWILFCLAKREILLNKLEILEAACLLCSVLLSLLTDPELPFYSKHLAMTIQPDCNSFLELLPDKEFEFIGFPRETDYTKCGEFFETITGTLLQLLSLRDTEVFKLIHGEFASFYSSLKQSQVLFWKSSTPENMAITAASLDKYYERVMVSEDIDERCFLSTSPNLKTPGRFTPFHKQGNYNKGDAPLRPFREASPRGKSSHRILTYDESSVMRNQKMAPVQGQAANGFSGNPTMAIPMPGILTGSVQPGVGSEKSPSTGTQSKWKLGGLTQSPYKVKTMPSASPMTTAMEMYNWLYEKVRQKSGENPTGANGGPCLKSSPTVLKYFGGVEPKALTQIQSNIEKIIERIAFAEHRPVIQESSSSNSNNRRIWEKRRGMLAAYFMRSLEEIIQSEEKKIQTGLMFTDLLLNESFHKALLAACVESAYFILNVTAVSFSSLLEIIEIKPFEFWRVLTCFVRFDASMPAPLKKHILDLEIRIITQLAWKKDSQVILFIKAFFGEETSRSNTPEPNKENSLLCHENRGGMITREPPLELTQPLELFFKRVLQHTAIQVQLLCSAMNMGEKVSEQVWILMKYLLSTETDLLIEHNIDQMILCSIYGVSKVLQVPIKFQEIIAKYQEVNAAKKTIANELIYRVTIDNGTKGDLIMYYNVVFVNRMKSFLLSVNSRKINSSSSPSMTPPMFIGTPQATPNGQGSGNDLPGSPSTGRIRAPASIGMKRHLLPANMLHSPMKALLATPLVTANGQSNPHGSTAGTGMANAGANEGLNEGTSRQTSSQKDSPGSSIASSSRKTINFDDITGYVADSEQRTIKKYHLNNLNGIAEDQNEYKKFISSVMDRKSGDQNSSGLNIKTTPLGFKGGSKTRTPETETKKLLVLPQSTKTQWRPSEEIGNISNR